MDQSFVKLPFAPPLEPMLAQIAEVIPAEGDWLFEPKWDGFRALVFRDHDELLTQSRDRKPLDRYFPELQEPLRRSLPDRCVVDGEIILSGPAGLDFEALQLRIHPAESRIRQLAAQTPAAYVVFDLLALDDRDLRGETLAERRRQLEEALGAAKPPVFVTPATRDRQLAQTWYDTLEGAGIEGLIAKPLSLTYQPKKRVMLKIKHVRTADCVVAGFRWHKNGPGTLVGSLLLGLYDDQARLHHVGITSSFRTEERRALVAELEPLRAGAADDHPWVREWGDAAATRQPGGLSRWSQGKDLSWQPLRLERVAEVKYDYLQGGRFRHATTFLRWRTDKQPAACRYDQLERPSPVELGQILGVR